MTKDQTRLTTLNIHNEPRLRVKHRVLAPLVRRYRGKVAASKTSSAIQQTIAHFAQTSDRRLLYVKNYKCGTTSILSELYRYSTGCYPPNGVAIHKSKHALIQGHYGVFDNLQALNNPAIFKFTFARHPYSRFLSGFQDFIGEARNLLTPRLASQFEHFGVSPKKSEAANIDAAIDCIQASFEKDPMTIDTHFRSQTINMAWGSVEYDFIGRLENLTSDLRYVFEQVGACEYASSITPQTPRNKSKSIKPELNKAQKRRLKKLYEADFETFGYDAD